MTSSPHMSNMFLGQSLFYCSDSLTGLTITVNLHMHAKCNRPIWGKAGWMTRELQSRIVSLFLDCFLPWGLTAELTDFHDLTSWHWDVSNWSWSRWCSSLWWSMTHTHTLIHAHSCKPTPFTISLNGSPPPQKNIISCLYWFLIYLFYPSICIKVRTCAFGSHASTQSLNIKFKLNHCRGKSLIKDQ